MARFSCGIPTAMSSKFRASRLLPPHWREYAIEGTGLGLFLISASGFGVLLQNPQSPVYSALPDPFVRRFLMGIAMGGTAVGLIYSRWGKLSGAHFNPAVTLIFFRLGKVAPVDLAGYIAAQFSGGALGGYLAALVLGKYLADPHVNFVVTNPGSAGVFAAFAGEALITALLMTVVLLVSNHARWAPFTGWCAGICIALFICFEAPLSGMSMNPARTVASALVSRQAPALWIYFVAPPLGMLAAASAYEFIFGTGGIFCAKLQHPAGMRCIFCEFQQRKLLVSRGQKAAPKIIPG